MGRKKIMGIYKIRNKINNKIYIGSSIDIFRRWDEHKTKLNGKYHRNRHLQNAWNKYGKENFEFSIIEEVKNQHYLLNREQYWMDLTQCYDEEIGYNLSKNAERSGCVTKRSKEFIENRLGELHPNTNLNNKDVIEIKLLLRDSDLSLNEIGELYNIGRQTVSNINSKLCWSHVKINNNMKLSIKLIKIIEDIHNKRNNKVKLNEQDVKNIKLLLRDSDITKKDIAKIFSISADYVTRIERNRRWKNIIINEDDKLSYKFLMNLEK